MVNLFLIINAEITMQNLVPNYLPNKFRHYILLFKLNRGTIYCVIKKLWSEC